ncbi:MAG: hypothetical protein ACFWTL_07240 [Atopobium sp.]
MYDYDVAFIGSGHAAWHAALMLRKAGKRVAFVEEDTVAGTCTNWGCNAKILLDTPFDYVDGLERFRGMGIDSVPSVNWKELMAYKKKVVNPMHTVLEGMFQKAGMPVYHAHGTLVDAHTIQAGDERITAETIVLGTGEHPRKLAIPGSEHIHDSRDFLDLDQFPARIAFIGAGIISMEFASIAAKLGAETAVIQHDQRILGMYPKKYVDRVVQKMEQEGVTFLLDHDVTEVKKTGEAYQLVFSDGETLETDYVLGATGREANVEGLGLDALGIACSPRGIEVDDHMRTSVPNIYASGDCVAKRIPKLTPTATFESNYIAAQILGLSDAPISSHRPRPSNRTISPHRSWASPMLRSPIPPSRTLSSPCPASPRSASRSTRRPSIPSSCAPRPWSTARGSCSRQRTRWAPSSRSCSRRRRGSSKALPSWARMPASGPTSQRS